LTLLRAADDGPAVVVCNTCKLSAEERETPDGVRGGALLAAALREIAAQDPASSGVAIQEMPCLFNCTQHCSIHLRAPGKIGYVLGRFEPTAEAARAILDYAMAYAASDEGVVPYRQWPEGVKGHFIVRLPPAGKLVGE
jgi:predicted metal-binding protein